VFAFLLQSQTCCDTEPPSVTTYPRPTQRPKPPPKATQFGNYDQVTTQTLCKLSWAPWVAWVGALGSLWLRAARVASVVWRGRCVLARAARGRPRVGRASSWTISSSSRCARLSSSSQGTIDADGWRGVARARATRRPPGDSMESEVVSPSAYPSDTPPCPRPLRSTLAGIVETREAPGSGAGWRAGRSGTVGAHRRSS
jgi:hypothetical protein